MELSHVNWALCNDLMSGQVRNCRWHQKETSKPESECGSVSDIGEAGLIDKGRSEPKSQCQELVGCQALHAGVRRKQIKPKPIASTLVISHHWHYNLGFCRMLKFA